MNENRPTPGCQRAQAPMEGWVCLSGTRKASAWRGTGDGLVGERVRAQQGRDDRTVGPQISAGRDLCMEERRSRWRFVSEGPNADQVSKHGRQISHYRKREQQLQKGRKLA